MRRFAITDIHGCLQSFQALLKLIDLKKEDELYILGDYIDRGPDSRGVIDLIWELQATGHKIVCLKGNHEQLLLDSFYSADSHKHWLQHGALQTLSSFNTNHLTKIPAEYVTWMSNLPHYHLLEDYILVHAGLNFKQEDPMNDTVSMLWLRNWYENLDREWLQGRTILHGHTPIIKAVMEEMLENIEECPVLDLDGGCVFREDYFRKLIAFDLDQRTLYFQGNVEDR